MTTAWDDYKVSTTPLDKGRVYVMLHLADSVGDPSTGGLLPILFEPDGVLDYFHTGNVLTTGGTVQTWAPEVVLAAAASADVEVGIAFTRPYGNVNLDDNLLVNGAFIGGHIPADYANPTLAGDTVGIDPNTELTLKEILDPSDVDDYLTQVVNLVEAHIDPGEILRPIWYMGPPPVYSDLGNLDDHYAAGHTLGCVIGLDSMAVIDPCYDEDAVLTGDAFTIPTAMDHVNGHGLTCLLWFQADKGVNGSPITDANSAETGDPVDSWTDRSTNDNEATGNPGDDIGFPSIPPVLDTRPTYRGLDGPGGTRPCIRLTTIQKLTFDQEIHSEEGMTVAIVHKAAALAEGNLLLNDGGNASFNYHVDGELALNDDGALGISSSGFTRGSWTIAWFERTPDDAAILQDGNNVTIDEGSPGDGTFTFNQIGGLQTGILDIYGVFVFRGVLNANSRRLIHNFIEDETGIVLAGSDIDPQLAEIPAAKMIKDGSNYFGLGFGGLMYEPFDTNESDRINDYLYNRVFTTQGAGTGIVSVTNRHLAGFNEASIIATGFDDNGGRADIAELYPPSTAVSYNKANIATLAGDPETYIPRAAVIIGNNGGTIADRTAAAVWWINRGYDVWWDPFGYTTDGITTFFTDVKDAQTGETDIPSNFDGETRWPQVCRLRGRWFRWPIPN